MSATASHDPQHRPLAAIDRHVAQEILYDVLDTVSPRNEDTEEQRNNRDAATLTMLDALNPRNILEAMVAAHVVASHYAAMHSFRVAMETDRRDKNLTRIRNCAAGLSRLFFQAVALLKKLQAEDAAAKAAQAVTIIQPPTSASTPAAQPTTAPTNPPSTRVAEPQSGQPPATDEPTRSPIISPNPQSARSNSA